MTIFISLALAIFSCKNDQDKGGETGNFPDLKSYFQHEIKVLDSARPSATKTIVENDEPKDTKFDSLDWNKEFAPFQMLDLASEGNKDKFKVIVDSSLTLKTTYYQALDTMQQLQLVTITEKDGNMELIEGFLKTRTFTLDRDTRLSYQPGKGYGIQIWENYVWSQPKRKEVYVQIDSRNFLRR
jgi:hypothetical protein